MTTSEEKIEEKVEKADKEPKQEEARSQEDILVDQLAEGMETYRDRKTKVLLSAVIAGLEIGFSFLLLGILHTILKERASKDVIFHLLAFAYPVGFIIVVLGKSILFTEQTSLLALPIFHKKRSVGQLIKIWGIIIGGNLVGGYIFALLGGQISLVLEIVSVRSIEAIAYHVTKPNELIIFGSSIFAGWLMAVLSWLLSSSKETISKILIIYIITFTVGFAGLHHSIVGNIEVFAGLIFTSKISIADYLGFQCTTLLGNAIGGVVFVAALRYRAITPSY